MISIISKNNLISIILFNISWWSCVLSGSVNSNDHPYIAHAYLITATIIILYARLFGFLFRKILISIFYACLGICIDAILTHYKFFEFSTQLKIYDFFPWWLVFLWLIFAMWFIEAKWLNSHYGKTALFFLFGGPIGYYSGKIMGAITFSTNILPFLAGCWLFLGSILFFLSQKLLNPNTDI